MRHGQAFIPTLKEVPAEAQLASHVFMIRGGFLRKAAAGIYSFLPLGWRVVQKIAGIVRQEMDRAGASEIFMPAAVPAELWQESGRWAKYGPELLRFKDRKGADFLIGPTHEEVVVDLVRREVKSYRDLPKNLYQIQTKFRDELRPRAGLLRGREFLMKDAYSFHVSAESARHTYDAMYAAYEKIFTRCGLEFRAVEADTGNIGGSLSHEFQVLAQTGEDALVGCDTCSYAANVEQAEVRRSGDLVGTPRPLEKVHTPGKGGIAEVAAFLNVGAERLIKTLVFLADGKPTVALVRGDHDVNEIKLKKALQAHELVMAGDKAVAEVTGAPVGYVGPIGLKDLRIVGDLDVRLVRDGFTGANERDHHVGGVDAERDLAAVEWLDLRVASAGDGCPRCQTGRLRGFKGIEVGHVFYLGTRYSAPMGCEFLDEKGVGRPMEMGCYGIGVTRVAAAAIEQHHDEAGIVWPMSIAPYQVSLLTLQAKDAAVVAAAEALYAALTAAGVEVLYDDRDERPGTKFKDADLIGLPLRVAVGKKSLAEGKLELKWRNQKDGELIDAANAAEIIVGKVRGELARLGG